MRKLTQSLFYGSAPLILGVALLTVTPDLKAVGGVSTEEGTSGQTKNVSSLPIPSELPTGFNPKTYIEINPKLKERFKREQAGKGLKIGAGLNSAGEIDETTNAGQSWLERRTSWLHQLAKLSIVGREAPLNWVKGVPGNFNWFTYLDLNPHLKGRYNLEQSKNGLAEGAGLTDGEITDSNWLGKRTYWLQALVKASIVGAEPGLPWLKGVPGGFDWKTFLKLNPDLEGRFSREQKGRVQREESRVLSDSELQNPTWLAKRAAWLQSLVLAYLNDKDVARPWVSGLPEKFDWRTHLKDTPALREQFRKIEGLQEKDLDNLEVKGRMSTWVQKKTAKDLADLKEKYIPFNELSPPQQEEALQTYQTLTTPDMDESSRINIRGIMLFRHFQFDDKAFFPEFFKAFEQLAEGLYPERRSFVVAALSQLDPTDWGNFIGFYKQTTQGWDPLFSGEIVHTLAGLPPEQRGNFSQAYNQLSKGLPTDDKYRIFLALKNIPPQDWETFTQEAAKVTKGLTEDPRFTATRKARLIHRLSDIFSEIPVGQYAEAAEEINTFTGFMNSEEKEYAIDWLAQRPSGIEKDFPALTQFLTAVPTEGEPDSPILNTASKLSTGMSAYAKFRVYRALDTVEHKNLSAFLEIAEHLTKGMDESDKLFSIQALAKTNQEEKRQGIDQLFTLIEGQNKSGFITFLDLDPQRVLKGTGKEKDRLEQRIQRIFDALSTITPKNKAFIINSLINTSREDWGRQLPLVNSVLNRK